MEGAGFLVKPAPSSFAPQGACRMSALPLRVGLTLLLVSFLVATVGCAEQLANVSGEIKVKDKPLDNGLVTFISQGRKKRVKTSPVEKGKYSITGIPVGKVLITVTGTMGDPKDIDKKTKKAKMTTVNAKYGAPNTSGLEYTVVAGDQEHPITLEP
jgi:hypothetical protein